MSSRFKLSSIIILLLLCCGISLQAQEASTENKSSSKVVIKTTTEDADGKKMKEVKELTGEEAENFDSEAYIKALEEKGIKVLTIDISKEVMISEGGELHEAHDMKIMKKKHMGMKKEMGKGKYIVEKEIKTDGDEGEKEVYIIKEKDGNVFVNDKEVKGKQKKIKIIQSGDDEKEMKVEVKDGKVFINGEEVEDAEGGDMEKHVIIKKSGEGSGANLGSLMIMRK